MGARNPGTASPACGAPDIKTTWIGASYLSVQSQTTEKTPSAARYSSNSKNNEIIGKSVVANSLMKRRGEERRGEERRGEDVINRKRFS